jgi:hypothetical protein
VIDTSNAGLIRFGREHHQGGLMPTIFEDEDVILYLLRRRRVTDVGEEHVIARTTFRRCRLLGPVHLRVGENVVIEDCNFEPSQKESVLAVDAGAFYVGALGATDCRFEACTFDNVRVVVASDHELAA